MELSVINGALTATFDGNYSVVNATAHNAPAIRHHLYIIISHPEVNLTKLYDSLYEIYLQSWDHEVLEIFINPENVTYPKIKNYKAMSRRMVIFDCELEEVTMHEEDFSQRLQLDGCNIDEIIMNGVETRLILSQVTQKLNSNITFGGNAVKCLVEISNSKVAVFGGTSVQLTTINSELIIENTTACNLRILNNNKILFGKGCTFSRISANNWTRDKLDLINIMEADAGVYIENSDIKEFSLSYLAKFSIDSISQQNVKKILIRDRVGFVGSISGIIDKIEYTSKKSRQDNIRHVVQSSMVDVSNKFTSSLPVTNSKEFIKINSYLPSEIIQYCMPDGQLDFSMIGSQTDCIIIIHYLIVNNMLTKKHVTDYIDNYNMLVMSATVRKQFAFMVIINDILRNSVRTYLASKQIYFIVPGIFSDKTDEETAMKSRIMPHILNVTMLEGMLRKNVEEIYSTYYEATKYWDKDRASLMFKLPTNFRYTTLFKTISTYTINKSLLVLWIQIVYGNDPLMLKQSLTDINLSKYDIIKFPNVGYIDDMIMLLLSSPYIDINNIDIAMTDVFIRAVVGLVRYSNFFDSDNNMEYLKLFSKIIYNSEAYTYKVDRQNIFMKVMKKLNSSDAEFNRMLLINCILYETNELNEYKEFGLSDFILDTDFKSHNYSAIESKLATITDNNSITDLQELYEHLEVNPLFKQFTTFGSVVDNYHYSSSYIQKLINIERKKIKDGILFKKLTRELKTVYIDSVIEYRSKLNKNSNEYSIYQYIENEILKLNKNFISDKNLIELDKYLIDSTEFTEMRKSTLKYPYLNFLLIYNNARANYFNPDISDDKIKEIKSCGPLVRKPNMIYLYDVLPERELFSFVKLNDMDSTKKVMERYEGYENSEIISTINLYFKDNNAIFLSVNDLEEIDNELITRNSMNENVKAFEFVYKYISNVHNMVFDEKPITLYAQSLQQEQIIFRMNVKKLYPLINGLNNYDTIGDKIIKSIKNYVVNSNHPTLRGTWTIAWVRYNIDEKNKSIWINEVQTDISKTTLMFENSSSYADTSVDKALSNIMFSFQNWVKKHYTDYTIVFPSASFRKKIIGGAPSVNAYDNLAKKYKFVKSNFSDTPWSKSNSEQGIVYTWSSLSEVKKP